MRIFFTLLILLSIFPFISALELTLTPPHLNIQTEVGNKICKNITISSDKSIIITLQDSWTNSYSRNLNDYNLTSKDLDIAVDSAKSIFLQDNKKLTTEICFNTQKSGTYYGAVLFQSENGYASVGTWVELNINKKSSNLSITGNMIDDFVKPNFLAIGLFALIVQIIVLGSLLRKNKQ